MTKATTQKATRAMKRAVLVLGATSPIARGVAAALARRGHDLVLAGGSTEDLERIAADLTLRFGVAALVRPFDAAATEGHAEALGEMDEAAGGLAGVVLAFAHQEDEATAQREFTAAARILDVTYRGAVSALTHLAAWLEARGDGFLVVVTSVAGDRGRRSNYVYGSAKAGLDAYVQGLRARLHRSGVRVLTVRPGFVDTASTFGRPGVFAAADPDALGEAIARALERGEEIVYLPRFWRGIMTLLRHLPETLFKRLDL
jgi:short-subunit dehydrogenase